MEGSWEVYGLLAARTRFTNQSGETMTIRPFLTASLLAAASTVAGQGFFNPGESVLPDAPLVDQSAGALARYRRQIDQACSGHATGSSPNVPADLCKEDP